MANIILAPICSNCHHVFDAVEWTSSLKYDEENKLYSKEIQHTPESCPKCGESLNAITGAKFPPSGDNFSFKL